MFFRKLKRQPEIQEYNPNAYEGTLCDPSIFSSHGTERIDIFIKALHSFWIKNPELRFGQVINCMLQMNMPRTRTADIYNFKDQEWLTWIEEMAKRAGNDLNT